jgi:hypothetical protein
MIKLLKLDETRNWDQETLDSHRIRRVFGVYVFDSILRVHYCEFTPSYELHWIEDQAEFADCDSVSDEEVEAADEIIREGGRWTEEVHYLHCHAISSLPRFKQGFFPPEDSPGGILTLRGFSRFTMKTFSEDGRRDGLIEEAREYIKQNGV